MTDEEIREARNAYAREWRRKNPDKVRATMRRYWERRATREAEQWKEKAQEADRSPEVKE